MRYPAKTPGVVRDAVNRYVRLRRLVASVAIVALGLALAGAVALIGMGLDRFWELPAGWRSVGPVLAWVILISAALGVLGWFVVWRPRPLAMAIRLDNHFPMNRDTWSTALDLALREEQGVPGGKAGAVSRVWDEAAAIPAPGIGEAVPKGWLVRAVAALLLIAMGFLILQMSSAFQLPLLWQRFWQPEANLPRDSYTRIAIVQVNGAAHDGGELAALPEESAFTLSVALTDTRPGRDPNLLPPQLEIVSGETVQIVEMTREREGWGCKLPRVQEAFRFRVRAGDGLTRSWIQVVEPRIKIDEVRYAVRFPRYANRPDVEDQQLELKRLALLAESRVTFHFICNAAYRELTATFEPLEKPTAEVAPLSQEELLKVGRQGETEQAASSRRTLRVSQRDERTGRLNLRVEESGILRVQAVGENGLSSQPWVLVIEAVADASPRITVTGVDIDTTILPGELVAFQYRAEDDLAIVDLVLAWWTAGSATTHDLAGEEYIKSDDFGKAVVTGQELIQRMNYKVYATQPFEFQLLAIDSKGQEAKSLKYRIHIIDDDHAARFERAIEFLQGERTLAVTLQRVYREIGNQLNILRTAVGERDSWPEDQASLLTTLESLSRQISMGYEYERNYFTQRYAGFPWRIDRSIMRMLAARQSLASSADYFQMLDLLRQPGKAQEALRKMQEGVEMGLAQGALLEAAAAGELARFTAEQALQSARKLTQRFTALEEVRGNAELHAANLEFYLKEVATMLANLDGQQAQLPDLEALKTALRQGHAEKDPDALLPLLREMTRVLASHQPPPTEAGRALVADLARRAKGDAVQALRLQAAVADVIRARGQETPLPAADILTLAELLPVAQLAGAEDWYDRPLPGYAAWNQVRALHEELRSFHLDIRAARYDLYPQAMHDREAVLREHAIAVAAQVARVVGLTPERRQQVEGALAPFLVTGFAEELAAREPAALAALKVAGSAEGRGDLALAARQGMGTVARELRSIADAADAHGASLSTMIGTRELTEESMATLRLPFAGDAAMLQRRLFGMEATWRAAVYLLMMEELGQGAAPLPWERLAPLHELQLTLTTVALRAQDRLQGRHLEDLKTIEDYKQHNEVTARNARELAAELRVYAGLIEAVTAGTPIEHDFSAIVKESKTTGHLASLETEYQYLSPYLREPPQGAGEEEVQALRASQLGKVVERERILLELERLVPAVLGAGRAPGGGLADLLQEAKTLIAPLDDPSLMEQLDQTQRLASAEQVNAAVLARRVQEAGQLLQEKVVQLHGMVRLPALNTTGRENRRFTSGGGIPYLWTIATLVENYDRRWLAHLQSAELDLVRELMLRAFPPSTPVPPDALVRQYCRMIELRARNLANEQRRNRGIGFLQQDAGPSLKLPEHIAAEFFKGRNRKSPEGFAQPIERYYDNLYRDLSR